MPSPSQERGARHEALAEEELVARGLVVFARNWRGKGGELDRVCWLGELLVVVEIRSRGTEAFGTPAGTVGAGKQRKIVATTLELIQRELRGRVPMVRFDVVSVVDHPGGGVELTVIENAFDAGAFESWHTGAFL